MRSASRWIPFATLRLAATSSSGAFVALKSSCSNVPFMACATHVLRVA
jgi:hypothetical protein